MLHPRIVRAGGAAGGVDTARGDFHDEEQVVGDKTGARPDLDRGEVDGGEDIPVSREERLPGSLPLAFGRRFDAVLLEDVADGSIGDVVAAVGESTLDVVVTPRGFSRATRSTRSTTSGTVGGRPGVRRSL